jgi:hypothetical protein
MLAEQLEHVPEAAQLSHYRRSGRVASCSSVVGSPCELAHVQAFSALADYVIRDIGANAFQDVEHADCRMVIEYKDGALFVARYLGTPVALIIPEYAAD